MVQCIGTGLMVRAIGIFLLDDLFTQSLTYASVTTVNCGYWREVTAVTVSVNTYFFLRLLFLPHSYNQLRIALHVPIVNLSAEFL